MGQARISAESSSCPFIQIALQLICGSSYEVVYLADVKYVRFNMYLLNFFQTLPQIFIMKSSRKPNLDFYKNIHLF